MNRVQRVKLGSAVAGLVFCFSSAVAAQETGRARVRGSVVNEDGEPVAGARVLLEHTQYDSVVERATDEDGNWIAAGLRGGLWNVTVTAEGHEPRAVSLEVSEARRNPPIDVTLSRVVRPPPSSPPDQPVAATALAVEANEAYNASDYARAVELYQELLQSSPEVEVAKLRLGSAYVQMGRFDDGIAQLESYLENHPESADALMLIGEAYVLEGDMEEAIGYLSRVSLENIDDADLAYNMGEIYFQSGDLEEATEAYARATELRPSFHEAYYKRGLVAVSQSDLETAKGHMQRVIDLAPDSQEASLARDLLAQIGGKD